MVRFSKIDFVGRFSVEKKCSRCSPSSRKVRRGGATGPPSPKPNQDWCKVGWARVKDVGNLDC